MLKIAIIALALILLPGAALAKCGSGEPPSYDDITSILLTNDYRIDDGYRDHKQPVSSIAESTYWVLFWEAGKDKSPTAYAQWTLRGSVGTFRINATLADAKTILRRADFFSLSPPDYTLSTEQTYSVLSVRRCAVVTRVIIDNYPQYQDPPSKRLLADFDDLIARSTKTTESNKPRNFVLLGFFNQ